MVRRGQWDWLGWVNEHEYHTRFKRRQPAYNEVTPADVYSLEQPKKGKLDWEDPGCELKEKVNIMVRNV
jgi:hypothetical protein